MSLKLQHFSRLTLTAALWGALLFLAAPPSQAAGVTAEQILATRAVADVELSPTGRHIAYRLITPRDLTSEDDGADWSELYVVSAETGLPSLFVQRPVQVSKARFTPDGVAVTYIAKRDDDEHKAIYRIALNGGESRKIVEFDTDILEYRVSPNGQRIAFIAKPAVPEAREKAKEKGYDAEVFEEQWMPRRIWVTDVPSSTSLEAETADSPLSIDGSAYDLRWLPDSKTLAATITPRPLIDDSYMFKRIRILDAETGEISGRIENPGKLGPFEVSPDGQHVAMISAADPNDPKEGRLKLAPVSGGTPKDLLPDLEAHVRALTWMDANHILAVIDRGPETQLAQVDLEGNLEEWALSGPDGNSPILGSVSWSSRTKRAAFVGEAPSHPNEVFVRYPDGAIKRRTSVNGWITQVTLAEQEVIRHKAKDGFPIEGILIRPLEPKLGTPAPLLMIVHGGPESHVRNGWVTNYSRPGQLLAAKGYAVFYPNYRGSTGHGVERSKTSQGDAAGKEFADLVDAVDHLVEMGVADKDRVGITGGSYGGYATAWASTYYTDRFKAGAMFVGISNKISKGFTTDIPVEDKMVHTLFDPWTRWEYSLERSPIFHVEKSRTPLLILVGKADPRVHPSQSLQMYRALKLVGKTPVRLVRYPGEPHGNRRAASKEDYLHRVIRWFDHFLLTDSKALPAVDIDGYLGMKPPEETDKEAIKEDRQERRAKRRAARG